MIGFVDDLYIEQIRQFKHDSQLLFEYSLFLAQYMKNNVKSTAVFKSLSESSMKPKISLRLILYCKSIEQSNGMRANSQSGNNQDSSSEDQSLLFNSQFIQAEEHHDNATSALKQFFEEALKKKPNFTQLPKLLEQVVNEEEKSRQGFEEIIIRQNNNANVLRRYAQLL
ncbi:MAG: hypothetical protein EZS28_032833 [Streblomastix strix]|uniref:TmcB/TmcC TPR repeats domain-containing protein n=1 Tax=Streblomastix strix TaxID=222440 RepID=A0A5J4UNM1_9EUKA|nr:MAG: hypothetical protein EZS28_032833 [Streblomastix strix]